MSDVDAVPVPVELKHDVMTSTMNIRVLGVVGDVPAEEVIRKLGSSCRASGVRKKIGDIVPVGNADEIACRVHLRSALEHFDELDVRDALLKGGFQCV